VLPGFDEFRACTDCARRVSIGCIIVDLRHALLSNAQMSAILAAASLRQRESNESSLLSPLKIILKNGTAAVRVAV